jgi:tyrosyl-tRNA synthetase
MEEIASVATLNDARLNMAKAVLAFEATKITHGEAAAVRAFYETARLFGHRPVEKELFPSSTIPRHDVIGEVHPKPPSLSLSPSAASSLPTGTSVMDEAEDRTLSHSASGTAALSVGRSRLEQGIPAFELFHEAKLCASRGEARRLIGQGGGYVNDRQIGAFDELICLSDADMNGEIRLRKGKKRYAILTLR